MKREHAYGLLAGKARPSSELAHSLVMEMPTLASARDVWARIGWCISERELLEKGMRRELLDDECMQRLTEYMERCVEDDSMLDIRVSDQMLDFAWPMMLRCMIKRGEFVALDKRLMGRYAEVVSSFRRISVTPLLLDNLDAVMPLSRGKEYSISSLCMPRFSRDSTDAVLQLFDTVGGSLRRVVCGEGIVPELLELLAIWVANNERRWRAVGGVTYECQSVTFREMLWVARWWQETQCKLTIETTEGERWRARVGAPPGQLPWAPPLRGETHFGPEDAEWIIEEAEKRRQARLDGYRCPSCGDKDKFGHHIRLDGVMLCELRRQMREAEEACGALCDDGDREEEKPRPAKRARRAQPAK